MSASSVNNEFVQIVSPRTGTRDGTGWCLRFTQSVFGAPAMHESATIAANNTRLRHETRDMPNVAVPVWFDHWGTYGSPLRYANWGHVVAWVPGHGFLSSPASGYGQQWFPSIDAVERAFNAKFRFWSEDINGLRVAQPGEDEMTPDQAQKLDAIYAGIFGPRNIGVPALSWASADGAKQSFYGNLEIDIHTQSLVAQLQGQVAALTQAVKSIPGGGGIDMVALEDAAERGAREALSGITLKVEAKDE